MSKTLVIVDCQYGFVDGGELPVGGGNKAVEFIINYIRERGASVNRILMTVDNHPAYHGSFKESEPFHIRIEGKSEESNLFPRHCVMNTKGAAIVQELMDAVIEWNEKEKRDSEKDFPRFQVIQKGMFPNREDYTAFKLVDSYIKDGDPTEFIFALPEAFKTTVEPGGKRKGYYFEAERNGKYVKFSSDEEVIVCGIAGDICVLNTLKALQVLHPTVFYEGCASLDGGTKLREYINDNRLSVDRTFYKKED
jgi:nicotinamidase/pyrazinamidase